LENRRSTNDEMSRGVWEEVENRKANKARIAEIERERRKKRRV